MLFRDSKFENPQRVLASRMSKIQVPNVKVMNKVPDRMLQKLLQEEKHYLPVALTGSPKRSPAGSGRGTPAKSKRIGDIAAFGSGKKLGHRHAGHSRNNHLSISNSHRAG